MRYFSFSICISIHAPREGSDFTTPLANAESIAFQSTLPVRGATYHRPQLGDVGGISIHAPREGSDLRAAFVAGAAWDYFNPRSP